GTEGLRQRLYEAIDLIWTVISASPDRQLLTYEIVSYSLRTHGLPEIGLAGDQQSSNEEIVRSVLERTAESSGMRWTMDIDDMIRVVMCMIDGIGLRWEIYRDDDEGNELLHRAGGGPPVRHRRDRPLGARAHGGTLGDALDEGHRRHDPGGHVHDRRDRAAVADLP